jgi:hypothetical protein
LIIIYGLFFALFFVAVLYTHTKESIHMNIQLIKAGVIGLVLSACCLGNVAHAELVHSYSFSGNALDETGNANGLVTGAQLTTDRNGVANSAYVFDGNDSIFADFDAPETATYAFWATWGGKDWSMLFNSGPSGAGPDLYFHCTTINWNVWDGCENSLGDGSTAGFSNDVWRQYVLVNDAATNAKLYVDGELFGTAAYRAPNAGFTVGAADTSGGYGWLGKIDEVKVYSTALSVSQVSALRNVSSVSNTSSISNVSTPAVLGSLALLGLFAACRRLRQV